MKNGYLWGAVIVIVVLVLVTFAAISYSGVKIDPATQLATGSPVQGVVLPEATNYAVDNAGVLTASELSDLNTRLSSINASTTQIAVLLVKSTSPLSIDEYGIKLAEKWKVGMKGVNNGAIIVIATEDRKVRLDIGYGLEGQIPDAVAGEIIRNDMGPLLHNNQWHDAIVAGITSILSKIK